MDATTYDEPAVDLDDLQDEDDDGGEGLRRVLALVLTLALIGLFIWLYFTFTDVVPDVYGLSEEDARAVLEEAGFEVGHIGVVTTDLDSAGVVEQRSDAGNRAWVGSEIDLFFPEGYGAMGAAAGDGGATTEEPGAPDYSFSFSEEEPEADDTTFTPGPPIVYPSVPLVMGVTEAEARATLAAEGYGVSVNYGRSTTDVATGDVYYQDPAPDAADPPGTTVVIWVSTGPPIEGTPYDKP